MLDGAYLDYRATRCVIPTDHSVETPEEEYRRQVREWTEALSNRPGWRGRLLRMALASGWC